MTKTAQSPGRPIMDLVNELQISAENEDVLTVLRKTRRLASKLDRKDIADWLQHEQDGYPDGQSVPDYRKVSVTLALHTNGTYIPGGYGTAIRGTIDVPSVPMPAPFPVRDSISAVVSWGQQP